MDGEGGGYTVSSSEGMAAADASAARLVNAIEIVGRCIVVVGMQNAFLTFILLLFPPCYPDRTKKLGPEQDHLFTFILAAAAVSLSLARYIYDCVSPDSQCGGNRRPCHKKPCERSS
jgi:hypothetical protein